ncbi:MAG: hypothetical protein JW946_04085 [Candidatus Omnitrophica bacterium]|nr:hypothetical protein [Candidatus Omnitrophota bacterium]
MARQAIKEGYIDKYGIGRQSLTGPDIFDEEREICTRCKQRSVLLMNQTTVGCILCDKVLARLSKLPPFTNPAALPAPQINTSIAQLQISA